MDSNNGYEYNLDYEVETEDKIYADLFCKDCEAITVGFCVCEKE